MDPVCDLSFMYHIGHPPKTSTTTIPLTLSNRTMSDSETPADTTASLSQASTIQLSQDDTLSPSINQPASPSRPPKSSTVLQDRQGTDPSPPSGTSVTASPNASLLRGGDKSSPSAPSPKKSTYTQPYDFPGMRMSVSAVLAGNARDMWHRGIQSAGYPAKGLSKRTPSPPRATAGTPVADDTPISDSTVSNSNINVEAATESETLPPWEKPAPESASNMTNEQLVRALTSVPVQAPDSCDKVIDAVTETGPPAANPQRQASAGNSLSATATTAERSRSPPATVNKTSTSDKNSSEQDAAAATDQSTTHAIPNQGSLRKTLDQAIRLDTGLVSQTTTEAEQQQQRTKKRKMEVTKRIVRNDKVWQGLAGFQEKRLGTYLYRPGKLFPVNAAQLNGCIDVLIPAVYLTYHNPEVKRRALWGTDIYTDDSDVVAMIVHCGKYSMPFVEPDIAPNDPLFLALGIDPAYTISTTATGLARSRNGSRSKSTTIPDHDLKVTLRVVPALKHYNGTIQNYIASRTWGSNHDGVSYHVERVEKTPKGLAQPCGRHAIKANMTQYAYDRYVTVGLPKTATTIQGDDEIMEEITPDMLWKPRSKKKKVALTSPSPTAEATQPSSASPDTPTTTGRRRTVRRAASKVTAVYH